MTSGVHPRGDPFRVVWWIICGLAIASCFLTFSNGVYECVGTLGRRIVQANNYIDHNCRGGPLECPGCEAVAISVCEAEMKVADKSLGLECSAAGVRSAWGSLRDGFLGSFTFFTLVVVCGFLLMSTPAFGVFLGWLRGLGGKPPQKGVTPSVPMYVDDSERV